MRDIAKEIGKESSVEMSKSHVQRMMDELGFSYKRPKLHVKCDDDPNYSRKRRTRGNSRITSE
jgi:transposase